MTLTEFENLKKGDMLEFINEKSRKFYCVLMENNPSPNKRFKAFDFSDSTNNEDYNGMWQLLLVHLSTTRKIN